MNNKSRRYALMSIIGLEKYATVVYNYIYYNLISSYRDSGKMKLAKIEGNGVVENQIVKNGNFEDSSDWLSDNGSFTIANNMCSFTATAQNGTLKQTHLYNQGFVNGHKYFIKADIKLTTATDRVFLYIGYSSPRGIGTSSTTSWQTIATFVDLTSSIGGSNCWFFIRDQRTSGWDTIQIKDCESIDLTLMFGTGNEPTTITDNRIQNLLNRGYIAYNQGEYKGTDVGEIATEPYNLFDENWLTTLDTFTSAVIASDYIKVEPSKTYSLDLSGWTSTLTQLILRQYDENKNIVTTNYYGISSPNTRDITLQSSTRYIKFGLNKSGIVDEKDNCKGCFHIKGSRTGYAPHKPSASIPFIFQGNGALNAHDTFEITSSEYVFTKNVSQETDISLFSWTAGSENRWFAYVSQINNMYRWTDNTTPANMLCSKYPTVNADSVASSTGYNTIYQSGGLLFIKDSSITQASDITGTLTYQLATPQVIRIPRKHLGIVDLGTLSYGSPNSYGRVTANAPTGIKPASGANILANVYCSNYLTYTADQTYGANGKIGVSVDIDGKVDVKDDILIGKTASEVQALLSGTYLFYETAEEVDDIVYKIKYENGGTITTDSEVLPNVTMEVQV